VTTTKEHTILSKSILKTLLYFDIFQYPLTASEIFKHLPTNHVTIDQVKEELTRLKEQSDIYPIQNFFSVQNNPALGSRRQKGNQLAANSLSLAQRQARLISRFPFVQAVMASGSLSKDYMDESSDLDFFVITKPNRLWIPRMLLTLYRKIFLSNSIKLFCTNYFVSEDHLEIEEKNVFTATELATLLPLSGKEYYEQLLLSNGWIKSYFPNYQPRSTEAVPPCIKNRWKQLSESVFNLMGGDRLEKIYEPHYSKNDFEIAFKTKPYASKGHEKNFQRKVLDAYQQKLDEFGNKLRINWDD